VRADGVPARRRAGLPVMVWIHGGGNRSACAEV
jgi:carboxylesterase type B